MSQRFKRATQSAHRLTRNYYVSMLSAAAVAAGLGATSAVVTGAGTIVLGLLTWTVFFLVVVNAFGIVQLYRPIRRYLARESIALGRVERRARLLPILSGLWIFALTAATMMTDLFVARGFWPMVGRWPFGVLAANLVHCLVFAAYVGVYSYMLARDHLISLRKAMWKRGHALPFRERPFVLRFVAVLVTILLGPVLIALSDQWGHASFVGMPSEGIAVDMSQLGQYAHQALHMDIIGAALLSAMLILMVARGLSRPVAILLDGMRRVDAGDLMTKAPIVSDDEFGMLTRRFNQMIDSLKDRERLRKTFAYFVPEDVAASLLADKGAVEPQEREASILFIDIEQFTHIATSLTPREVMVLLNGYFGEVATIIHRQRGVITQFQGDAVLASFNLPATDPDHARHALAAALEIQEMLSITSFHANIRLKARIGICTGLVVGGTVGGDERLGYTVHGDTVNIASRLEQLNKELGTRILLSERTFALLGGRGEVKDLGLVPIRGLRSPIRVFAPLIAEMPALKTAAI